MLTYNELIQKITELERKITHLEELVDQKNQIIERSINDLNSIVGQIVVYLNENQ